VPAQSGDSGKLARHVVTKLSVYTAGDYSEAIDQATALNYGDEISVTMVADLLGLTTAQADTLLTARNVSKLYDGGPDVSTYATADIVALLGHELMRWPCTPEPKHFTPGAKQNQELDDLKAEVAKQAEMIERLRLGHGTTYKALQAFKQQLGALAKGVGKSAWFESEVRADFPDGLG